MDEPDSIESSSDARKRELLLAARKNFEEFYRIATPDEAVVMDALTLAHTILVKSMSTPRADVAPFVRQSLERTCDSTERLYTSLREAVRGCRTFAALTETERKRIERVLFEVPHPPLA